MKTGLDWFVEELTKQGMFMNLFKEEIKKAKAMHKEEIIDAYANGHNDGCRYMTDNEQKFEHGEQYYNETFKR